jgi:hypothetical protein
MIFLTIIFCVFHDEHIIFLLVALHGGGSWWTAVRQISDVPVSVFEMFHQCCTVLAAMKESPQT